MQTCLGVSTDLLHIFYIKASFAHSSYKILSAFWYKIRIVHRQTKLKRFEKPDEVRTFEKGKFEIVRIGGITIGRAIYEPGWRWSLHVDADMLDRAARGTCPWAVVSGRATAAMDNGTIIEMRPGDVFRITPGHDSRVVGEEPYVSLHFLRGTTSPTVPEP